MVNAKSIAVPYANALFEIAQTNGTINTWLEYLKLLSKFGQNQDFIRLLNNPKVSSNELFAELISILDNPNETVANFLRLLLNNDRLEIIAEIYALFEKKAWDYQNTAKAIIQSAFAMQATEVAQFEQLLSNKFGKTITAVVEIKPELIGGVKFLINDIVIDASIKGSLNNLAAQLIK